MNLCHKFNSKKYRAPEFVTTKDGLKGIVQSINTLRQKVKVLVNVGNDEKEMREYDPTDLKFKKRQIVKEETEEEKEARKLEELERKDVKADL